MTNVDRLLLDTYLIKLVDLIADHADVEDFEKLYRDTFDSEPGQSIIDYYRRKVNGDEDYDSYSYEESSYSY